MKFRLKRYSLILIGLALLPTAFYVGAFWSRGISDNPADWAQFATYIAGMASPFLSIVNVLIIVYIAALANSINKKQHVPLGNIIVADYENRTSVDIQNAGLGPMIITRLLAVDTQGHEYNTLIGAFKGSGIQTWTSFLEEVEGRIIPPNEKLNLIEMKYVTNNVDSKAREIIRNVLKEIKVTVTYTDLYRDEKYSISRKLDFFGRHNRIAAVPQA
jgi:hypothetical protein